jgi:putative hemolysin
MAVPANLAIEVVALAVLIGINAFFSMAEFALVASSEVRLNKLAAEGDPRARAAVEMMREPNRYLSTIQVAITLIGILAGAYSGITFAPYIEPFFSSIPALADYALGISIIILVVATTYLTLVFGELVPKRIGLDDPERIARAVARPLQAFSIIALPVVKILSASVNAVLILIRHKKPESATVTEEEIWNILEEGARSGLIEEEEEEMVSAIFRLGDRRLVTMMTPRHEIVGIDMSAPLEGEMRKILASIHSYFPVYEDSIDTIRGILWARDLWTQVIVEGRPDLSKILREPTILPENTPALKLLQQLRTSGTPLALAVDEYGSITGLITLHDILKAIIGDVRSMGSPLNRKVTVREDGSFLIDGLLPVDEGKELLGVSQFPEERNFNTMAGFAMMELQKIPVTGDTFEWDGFRFEIVDMDGPRIDKILVSQKMIPESHDQ